MNPRLTCRRAFIAAGTILLAATGVTAKTTAAATPPEARFPGEVPETLVSDLFRVGRVEPRIEAPEADAWKRWGRAGLDEQVRAVRALAYALAAARPPIAVSAAILAIARVESGFNPSSRNPSSTACGIFQFIEATWGEYSPVREGCLDPDMNAWAGVKHLTWLHGTYVRAAMPSPDELPDELQRAEHVYRLLYAYHYHGERSAVAPLGGSIDSQLPAESGLPHLRAFFDILKRATYVPPPRVVRSVRARPAPKAPRARRRRGVLQRS